jgi:hypothetical protein
MQKKIMLLLCCYIFALVGCIEPKTRITTAHPKLAQAPQANTDPKTRPKTSRKKLTSASQKHTKSKAATKKLTSTPQVHTKSKARPKTSRKKLTKANQASKRTSAKAQTALLNQAKGLRKEVLSLGLRAFSCAWRKGELRKPLLTVIDYSMPSRLPRLWVMDVKGLRVLHTELVAHGTNSGADRALHFSNKPNSLRSSLGFFVTGETYYGKHGFSLRLDGKEHGINHLARKRAIVMHSAWYVSETFLKKHGRLGRSWGCPTLRKAITRPLLTLIKDKSALFIYARQKHWLQNSTYLHCTSR